MPKLNKKHLQILRNIRDGRKWWSIPVGEDRFKFSNRPSESQADALERLIRGGYVDRSVMRAKLLILTPAGRFYADKGGPSAEENDQDLH